jgi:chromosomal replication initiation ATPase DnaA
MNPAEALARFEAAERALAAVTDHVNALRRDLRAAGVTAPRIAEPALADILAAVAREYGTSPTELRAVRHGDGLAPARQLAAWLMMRATGHTTTTIARALGRERSNVQFSADRAQQRMDHDTSFFMRAQELLAELAEPQPEPVPRAA